MVVDDITVWIFRQQLVVVHISLLQVRCVVKMWIVTAVAAVFRQGRAWSDGRCGRSV